MIFHYQKHTVLNYFPRPHMYIVQYSPERVIKFLEFFLIWVKFFSGTFGIFSSTVGVFYGTGRVFSDRGVVFSGAGGGI